MLVKRISVDVALQVDLLGDLTQLRYVTLEVRISEFVELAGVIAQEVHLI